MSLLSFLFIDLTAGTWPVLGYNIVVLVVGHILHENHNFIPLLRLSKRA